MHTQKFTTPSAARFRPAAARVHARATPPPPHLAYGYAQTQATRVTKRLVRRRVLPALPQSTRACGASGATTAHSSAVVALPEWEVGV